jgi:uncharacterized protein (TIGR00369 family)
MSDTSPAFGTEQIEALILRASFHRWLGLKVLHVADSLIEIKAVWREEWIADPNRRHTHGGILSALIDIGASWALVSRLGTVSPTIDLRTDYHSLAFQGDLIVKGSALKFGRRLSTAEACILTVEGKVIASGRGVFLTEHPTGLKT